MHPVVKLMSGKGELNGRIDLEELSTQRLGLVQLDTLQLSVHHKEDRQKGEHTQRETHGVTGQTEQLDRTDSTWVGGWSTLYDAYFGEDHTLARWLVSGSDKDE